MHTSSTAAFLALSVSAMLALSSAARADQAMDSVRSVDAPSTAPAWETQLGTGPAQHVAAPETRVRHSSYRHHLGEHDGRQG